MRRALLPVVLVIVAASSTACTPHQAVPTVGLTDSRSTSGSTAGSPTGGTYGSDTAANSSTPGSAAAGSSVGPTTVAPLSGHAPTSAATIGPPKGKSSARLAEAGFLQLAHQAFPDRTTAQLRRTGQAICTNLRKDPSVHDEVGLLAGEINSQELANQIVGAAIAIYCPEIKR